MVCVWLCVCVFGVCLCGLCVCMFVCVLCPFFITFTHHATYTVILHALPNLILIFSIFKTESSKDLTNFTNKFCYFLKFVSFVAVQLPPLFLFLLSSLSFCYTVSFT